MGGVLQEQLRSQVWVGQWRGGARCSSISGGGLDGSLLNPLICPPERIQPDTRHPPVAARVPGPALQIRLRPPASSRPSSRAALGEPLHSRQILIFLLMTRRFGYRVLTASLLRDYSGQRGEVRPCRGDGFLPPLAKIYIFFFKGASTRMRRSASLKAPPSSSHWLTGRSRVTPQLFVCPLSNNCVCVCALLCVGALLVEQVDGTRGAAFRAAADYVAQVSAETL